jgi:prolyl oligopeptidase
MDGRPTLAAPDDDPRLWLEEVDGAQASAWVSEQNARTLTQFDHADMAVDQEALAAIEDHSDNIPYVTRRAGMLYNTWKDADHVRGLWRRTTLESYQTDTPAWETVLDFDALAKAESEDWVFDGSCVIPGTRDRAILRLSRGGADAVVMREFDLTSCRFIEDGFAVPEGKGSAVWYDHDTVLLCSVTGEGNATPGGSPRTVRIWRRGTDLQEAPVIFEITPDHNAVDVQVDDEGPEKRLIFVDYAHSWNYAIWIGDLSGSHTKLDLPCDITCLWDRGWLALRTRTAWTIGESTHAPGTVLGIGFDTFLEGSRAFEVLFTLGPRRICNKLFWANGRLVVSVMENLVPRHEIFTPSNAGWTSAPLGHIPNTDRVSVEVERLDEDEAESDGALLVKVQDPLNPIQLLLTSVTSASPITLKRAPMVFNAEGLGVTCHEAVSTDGERIPYVQIGPQGETGNAPVHMTAYGGFSSSVKPYHYRGGIGKIWLECGGTSIIAAIRGGGEFGPHWHEAGRREGKALCHDDFAAVAADLVTRGVTQTERIVGEGGSNGGLLMLNMLTRFPQLFGALLCAIPLADMRRYTKLLSGPHWIAEYGDPDKPEDWEFLQRISAYHTATAEGAAPPILLTTTRLDDRVHPGHARKMAAKLQDLGRDAWFYELDTGGHSYGKTNRERAAFMALGYTFLRDSIGWRNASPHHTL